MARRVSSRTVLNRKALTAIREGHVAGLEAMAQRTLELAQPNVPDDPKTPEQIVGDYGVWADGKKVAGTGPKPRAVRTKQGVTMVVGYPFPMRFYEEGTVHQPARPVLTPVMLDVAPDVANFVRLEVRPRLARVR
jgi:hypothetical protein